MPPDLARFSLADLKAFAGRGTGIGNFPARLCAETYTEFVQVLYEDLDEIISGLQENAHIVGDDSEDRLTLDIKASLLGMGYTATHDEQVGGHCDLLVRHRFGFLWIGEAKIRRGDETLWKGFQQLCTRYSIGDPMNSAGGLLAYIKVGNVRKVMEQWKAHFSTRNSEAVIEMCKRRPDMAFFSVHTHERSGLPFRVRHMAVILSHEPKA